MGERTPIRIFDTTLRDGEQSPGATLDFQEKLEIARQLDLLGVDVIEAGFPVTSEGDFQAVEAIGKELAHARVAGLARCSPKDIDEAGRALRDCPRGRIHVFCATSRIHREHKLHKPIEKIIEIAVDSVKRARDHVADVEFSPEDGSRTELNYLVDITGAAIDAGATTINIPDTVGYAVPAEYGAVFEHLRKELPRIDEQGVILSAHCHNDLGLATANSLSAVQHGARQVECTINGIGERAGNAALEEIAMAIRTRGDFYSDHEVRLDTTKIFPLSRLVATMTGLHVQRNKAVVGENAFAHEAGIHQDGVLKERTTYEIMDPRDIGVPESKIVLGKHSGRHAFRDHVAALGFTVDEETLTAAFKKYKALADKKKEVYDEDIEAILDEQLQAGRQVWELVKVQVASGTDMVSTATVVLRDESGREMMDAATGDGPIDAVYSALLRITGVAVTLTDFEIRSVTGGKDAQGEVSVEIQHRERRVRGRGLSTDVIEAAAEAYLAGLNRVKTIEAKRVPPTTFGEQAETEGSQP